MCSLYQKYIGTFSLHRTRRLNFVFEIVCVYCAVRNESISKIQVDFAHVFRAVAKAVSRRAVSMFVYRGFMVDKVSLGPAILRVLLLVRVSGIPTMIQTHLQLLVSLSRRTDG
jgi:hypothetical protein